MACNSVIMHCNTMRRRMLCGCQFPNTLHPPQLHTHTAHEQPSFPDSQPRGCQKLSRVPACFLALSRASTQAWASFLQLAARGCGSTRITSASAGAAWSITLTARHSYFSNCSSQAALVVPGPCRCDKNTFMIWFNNQAAEDSCQLWREDSRYGGLYSEGQQHRSECEIAAGKARKHPNATSISPLLWRFRSQRSRSTWSLSMTTSLSAFHTWEWTFQRSMALLTAAATLLADCVMPRIAFTTAAL